MLSVVVLIAIMLSVVAPCHFATALVSFEVMSELVGLGVLQMDSEML
jgi:hypothetical protein